MTYFNSSTNTALGLSHSSPSPRWHWETPDTEIGQSLSGSPSPQASTSRFTRRLRRSLGLLWRAIACVVGLAFGVTALTGDLVSYHGWLRADPYLISMGAKLFPWSHELRTRTKR